MYGLSQVEFMIDRLVDNENGRFSSELQRAFEDCCRRTQGAWPADACDRLIEAIRRSSWVPHRSIYTSLACVSDRHLLTAVADALMLRLSEGCQPESKADKSDVANALTALGQIALSPRVDMRKREEVFEVILTWAKAGCAYQHARAVEALSNLGALAVAGGAIEVLAGLLAIRKSKEGVSVKHTTSPSPAGKHRTYDRVVRVTGPRPLPRLCIQGLEKLAKHGAQARVLTVLAPWVQRALGAGATESDLLGDEDVNLLSDQYPPDPLSGLHVFMEALFAAWRPVRERKAISTHNTHKNEGVCCCCCCVTCDIRVCVSRNSSGPAGSRGCAAGCAARG